MAARCAPCSKEEAGVEEDLLQTATQILVGFVVQIIGNFIRKKRNAKKALRKVRKLEGKGKDIPEEVLKKAKKLKKREEKKEAGKEKEKETKKKHHYLFWFLVILVVVVILKVKG